MRIDTQLQTDYKNETRAPFTDNLTGLLNYGFFNISLEREIKRCDRSGKPFTLALIDPDAFGHYNKLHSMAKGDFIIKQLARITMQTIRQSDLAARFLGPMIAVMLIDCDIQSAYNVMERLRQNVKNKYHGDPTVSIGLASYPKDAVHAETLIDKAEEALQHVKLMGKNRVYFFEKENNPAKEEIPNILVVDDDPANVRLFEALLQPLNYQVFKAFSGTEALAMIKRLDFDLILLDIMMPDMDGYEVCRRIKPAQATRLIPVILITALDDMEAKVVGIEAGADDFLTKPANKTELLARTKSLIKLKKLNNNLTSIEHVLFSLARTVEAKDMYTQGHIERVSGLATSLGEKMDLPGNELKALRFGGALHDVGKIAVPGNILNKPGPLDDNEWKVMKSHSEEGCKICLPLKDNLGLALDIIRHHHEKLDGSGYPDGLKGDEISTVVRIMAVVDIYDALVTDRPYRKGMAKEKAFRILREEGKNGKLDKSIIEKLINQVG